MKKLKTYGLFTLILLLFIVYQTHKEILEEERDNKIQQKIQQKYAPILINDEYLKSFLTKERTFVKDFPIVEVKQIKLKNIKGKKIPIIDVNLYMKDYELTSISTHYLTSEEIEQRDKKVMNTFLHVSNVLNDHFKGEFILNNIWLDYEFVDWEYRKSPLKKERFIESKSLNMQGELNVRKVHWYNNFINNY